MTDTSAPVTGTPAAPHPSGLSLEERFALMRSVGEECSTDDELRNLLLKKPEVRCYDGFEPSGRMHIAQGVYKAVCVNKCTKVGCKFTFWVADWFALMNDKMGGELLNIQIVGKYLIEVWKAAGMDMENVDFRWSSHDINASAKDYWTRVIDVARKNTIARMKKCCQIMGREDGGLSAAQILYPLMQCTDIFHLKADVCQLGNDQRKVNMLAREYCDSIGRKLKPVILSHHMVSGLVKGKGKMSKSNPDSAIFMEDSASEVRRKIQAAWCPRIKQNATKYTDDGVMVGDEAVNPCLDYIKTVVFSRPGEVFHAGGATFATYEEAENAFVEDRLSENDLKEGLIDVLNALLQPVRDHFESSAEAKELLATVMELREKTAAAAASAAAASDLAPEVERSRQPASSVVAWMPVGFKMTVADALRLVDVLNASVASGEKVTLVLPDWTAMALTQAGGEEKDIAAAIELHHALLVAYGLSPEVHVERQSAVILADPDTYWLQVIAAGRKVSLGDVLNAFPGGTAPDAGYVVAALMRMSDIATFGATKVIGLNPTDDAIAALVKQVPGWIVPTTVSAPPAPFRATLCQGAQTTVDDVLYTDDSELDVQKKLKKAYAAPNESDFAIADIGCYAIRRFGKLEIKRGEANGGELTLTKPQELLGMCASGALHPADLKAGVKPVVLGITGAAKAVLSSPAGKKAATAVKAAEKRMAKKK